MTFILHSYLTFVRVNMIIIQLRRQNNLPSSMAVREQSLTKRTISWNGIKPVATVNEQIRSKTSFWASVRRTVDFPLFINSSMWVLKGIIRDCTHFYLLKCLSIARALKQERNEALSASTELFYVWRLASKVFQRILNGELKRAN